MPELLIDLRCDGNNRYIAPGDGAHPRGNHLTTQVRQIDIGQHEIGHSPLQHCQPFQTIGRC
jgi:hypothetical protein